MKRLAAAILHLQPNAQFVIRGTQYSDIEWHSDNPPSQAEVLAAVSVIESLEYKEKRKAEYPPIEEYLDGVVKGDQQQIQEYIAKCLAVKEKYPK